MNEEDIFTAVDLVAINNRVDFETRSFEWIKDLCEILNVPQTDLLIMARDNTEPDSYSDSRGSGMTGSSSSTNLGLLPSAHAEASGDPELASTNTFLDQTFHMINPGILKAKEKLLGAKTALCEQ